MAIKTNKDNYQKFLQDDGVWPSGAYYDCCDYKVNDETVDEFDLESIQATDKLVISYGTVFDSNGNEIMQLDTLYKKWLKAQKIQAYIVEIESCHEDELKKFIKSLGGKTH